MRRALVLVVTGALLALVPLATAQAGNEPPQGRFTSPTRAVAGAPIFVRSITSCPANPDPSDYGWVHVYIVEQTDPMTIVEETNGDLRPDRSWEVTLAAPDEMAEGVTKSYAVHAQCIGHDQPYYAPDRDPSVTTSTLAPAYSYHRYYLRPLYVTGYSRSPGADADAGTESSTTTSSTSTTQPTSTTIATPTTLSAQSAKAGGGDAMAPLDARARSAEARLELLRRSGDGDEIDVELSAAAAAATSPMGSSGDGGIPWWAFVAATILAVGSIIGWGAKRQSSVL